MLTLQTRTRNEETHRLTRPSPGSEDADAREILGEAAKQRGEVGFTLVVRARVRIMSRAWGVGVGG